ncbi:choice-of-anchor A family protein [Aestuariispira insulae]|uniref:Putative secreted protein with PEP-CTERM sorting signal/choice-of-anchor A domain-containing protein n=1 Tax=Aestuariispira insulae TaxID=1461337 RepID=A0A3D9H9E8_9PROT|nr:choice-of-anchor A family protein [Aestuariispira insulae]RED46108.1 putative secreted protein with PEP-CTERM sorting signal/choice-of-anchor A domain-containing protein [Aestuariispira insulae]
MKTIYRALGLLAVGLLAALPARAGVIDLGTADDYTLLATGSAWGGSMVLGSEVDIGGNIGARDSVLIGTGSTIDGNVDGGLVHFDASTSITGAVQTRSGGYWDQVTSDLKNASLFAANMAGSDRGNITDTTILSGGGVSVFHLDGLALGSGETLFLDGDATSEFVINVSGSFIMNGGAEIALLNGLQPANVTFNILEASLIQMNNAIAVGTFIAPESYVQLGDGNILEATRFLGGAMQGNLQSVRPPSVVDVPAPAMIGLMLIAIAGVGTIRRSR